MDAGQAHPKVPFATVDLAALDHEARAGALQLSEQPLALVSERERLPDDRDVGAAAPDRASDAVDHEDEHARDQDQRQGQPGLPGADRDADADAEEQVDELLRVLDRRAEAHDREGAEQAQRDRDRCLDRGDQDDRDHGQQREDLADRVARHLRSGAAVEKAQVHREQAPPREVGQQDQQLRAARQLERGEVHHRQGLGDGERVTHSRPPREHILGPSPSRLLYAAFTRAFLKIVEREDYVNVMEAHALLRPLARAPQPSAPMPASIGWSASSVRLRVVRKKILCGTVLGARQATPTAPGCTRPESPSARAGSRRG